MRKKTYILLLLLLSIFSELKAQQDAMFSQYMFNMLTLNPAYAGSRDVLSTTAMRRWQWVNIDGAPRTTFFSADMPIANKKIGLGLLAYNDKIGATNTNAVYLNYAYRIRLRKGTLALGLNAGFAQYKADFLSLTATDNGDPIGMQNVNKFMPNFGFGAYYSTDRFYVGISTPHLMNNRLSRESTSQAIQRRHFFAMTGVVIPLSLFIKVKPSVLVKYVEGAPLQLDGNVNFWFDDRISLGASYRTGDAIVGMLEVQITPQLRIGYAYDASLTRVKKYSSGSHELMVRYEFGFGRSQIISPRYF